MCIPHGITATKSNGYVNYKSKKSVKRVSQSEFEYGDPDFVDERINKEKPKKKSFIYDLITSKK